MEKSITNSEIYAKLIEILVRQRKDRKIKQVDLAKQLGEVQSFVSKYEQRERRLYVAEFIAIAQALGLDPAKIVKDLVALYKYPKSE